MKYFVHFTPKPVVPAQGGDGLSGDKATIAYIAELQKKGTLEVGYAFVTGGGVGFLNVASHEELWEVLYNYPGYTAFQWQVEPLADVAQIFSRAITIQEQETKK
jgi:hypothetical protein